MILDVKEILVCSLKKTFHNYSEAKLIENFLGLQGPPGLQGAHGSKGESGSQGAAGIQGIQGIAGNPGDFPLQRSKHKDLLLYRTTS